MLQRNYDIFTIAAIRIAVLYYLLILHVFGQLSYNRRRPILGIITIDRCPYLGTTRGSGLETGSNPTRAKP